MYIKVAKLKYGFQSWYFQVFSSGGLQTETAPYCTRWIASL